MADVYGILKIISNRELLEDLEAINRKELKDWSSFFNTLKFYNNLFYTKNYNLYSAWSVQDPYDMINERICQLNFDIKN